jgi:hypothetical protein
MVDASMERVDGMEKELFYEFYDRNQDVTALAC